MARKEDTLPPTQPRSPLAHATCVLFEGHEVLIDVNDAGNWLQPAFARYYRIAWPLKHSRDITADEFQKRRRWCWIRDGTSDGV